MLTNILTKEYNTLWYFNSRADYEIYFNRIGANDLVLTLDFGLLNLLKLSNVDACYIDKLISPEESYDFNIKISEYLNSWYFDDSCENNLLLFDGINVGEALKLNYYTDIVFNTHIFVNLLKIKSAKYKYIYICENALIENVANFLDIKYKKLPKTDNLTKPVYFFDIHNWMYEKINKTSLRNRLINICFFIIDQFNFVVDFLSNSSKKYIYVQKYFPTIQLIRNLDKFTIIVDSYSSITNAFNERRVVYKNIDRSNFEIENTFPQYFQSDGKKFVIEGVDISPLLKSIINKTIHKNLALAINNIISTKNYLKDKNLVLSVYVTDLWLKNSIIVQFSKINKVPIYFILNGLLNTDYYFDGKFADYINCYSESIKKNIFKSIDNVFPIGDPRLDKYNLSINKKRELNSKTLNIGIGAAAYNNTDVGSFLAYEFEYLNDVLTSISNFKDLEIVIYVKSRANNYTSLYHNFISEYYSHLNVIIVTESSFAEFIRKIDLYITFYSQTLFESSLNNVPCIYFNNVKEYRHEPFDFKSTLKSASNVYELNQLIQEYLKEGNFGWEFSARSNLEYFIGKFDNSNLQRNLNFINDIISQKKN